MTMKMIMKKMKKMMDDEQEVDAAGLGVRAGALLVDMVVLVLLHAGSSLIIGTLLLKTTGMDLVQIIGTALLYFIYLLVAPPVLTMLYFTVLHAFGGQTIGKMLFGLRVVSANGEDISGGVAFLRWAGTVVSALPLAVGFIWAIFDGDHCTWHDRLSGTRTVATRNILTSV